MLPMRSRWIGWGAVLLGCTPPPGEDPIESATLGPVTLTQGPTDGTGSGTESGPGTGSGSATETGLDDADTGIKFDVDDPDAPDTGPVDECTVVDDMDGIGPCEEFAPPDSFEPEVQWTYGVNEASWVTPLVANLTDDDGNGTIDLCDVPDVVLVANTTVSYNTSCYVHVLDGATGIPHFSIPLTEQVSCTGTPAIGDIDGDGLPEIVALWRDGAFFRLKAFEHDGTLKWANVTDNAAADQFSRESGSVALHDLDADGDVEIVFNHEVYDHNGVMLWSAPNPVPGEGEASVGVDLDGDGDMEVVTGHAAYHHDGSVYYDRYPTITSQAIPQIGNLDADPQPEIFVTSGQGLWMLEHDGTTKWGPATPTGVGAGAYTIWQRPGTIHDFDGDDVSEWASSSQSFYAVYEGPTPADVLWQVMVQDVSGATGGTAFDFDGNGVAEAMYTDEVAFRIYDGQTGAVLLTINRSSPTIVEYPVVADIDNDGSAEILVTSTSGQPALQAIRDVEDRWIQARRIWNQHAYYVTNVREDGTIPQVPVNNWETLNTYRTNAQIEGGGLCKPDPPG